MRGRTQGGLPEEERQPQDSVQAGHQDLVLHPHGRVRASLITERTKSAHTKNTLLDPLTVPANSFTCLTFNVK